MRTRSGSSSRPALSATRHSVAGAPAGSSRHSAVRLSSATSGVTGRPRPAPPEEMRKPRSARLPQSEPCSSASRGSSAGRSARSSSAAQFLGRPRGRRSSACLKGAERVDALPGAGGEVADGAQEAAVEVALDPQEGHLEPRAAEVLPPPGPPPLVVVRARVERGR